MPKVRVLKNIDYGKPYKPGDKCDVDPKYLPAMIADGLVEELSPSPAPAGRPNVYQVTEYPIKKTVKRGPGRPKKVKSA